MVNVVKGPSKVRFASGFDGETRKDGSQVKRRNVQGMGYRSALKELGRSAEKGILECLPDISDDEANAEDYFMYEKDCSEVLSRHESSLKWDKVERLMANRETFGPFREIKSCDSLIRSGSSRDWGRKDTGGSSGSSEPDPCKDAKADGTGAYETHGMQFERSLGMGRNRNIGLERSTGQTVLGSLVGLQPSLLQSQDATLHNVIEKKRNYRFKTRQRAQTKPVSRLHATRRELVQRTMHENPFHYPRPCCNAGCFYLIDPEYAVIQYRRFLLMDRQERKRALKAMYIRSARAFWFGGSYVCTRFLSKGLRFSNQLQCAVKGTPKARTSSSIEALLRRNMKETKKNQIVLYLRDLAERIGDSLPTKQQNNLPLMSKKQVFERFEGFNRNVERRENPSLSYWCKVWKAFCSDIKTHRRHGFTVCDTCEKIREGFEMAENECVEATLRKELAAHFEFVEIERRDYERRRDLSRRNPTKYLSLIVDGADQTSYGLPHFVFSTKEDRGEKIQVKIVGVLEHGPTKQLSLLTLTDEFESGSNHVIEALHRVLNLRKLKCRKFPPVLFVQADNCTRENKNRFTLSYLEMLVRKGVFEEVQLCFLPIGHTHEDIDQAFSSVATRLKLEKAITDHDMLDFLRHCYNLRAYVEAIDKVANFSGICEETSCIRNVPRFSMFRFFRFTRKASTNGAVQNEEDYVTPCDVKV